MNTLFPIEDLGFPEGFRYFPDFISKHEEKDLLEEIKKMQFNVFNFQGYEAKRKVISFGFDWNFEKRALTKGREIPELFKPLIERAASILQLKAEDFKELLVTEYPAGSVINWHRDAPPFEEIAGISLLSSCTFRLRPYNKPQQTKSSIIKISVHPRSLYLISKRSRTDWEHSITPVNSVRYSITLRTLNASYLQ